ncbi:uncharacterized protein QC763_704310 [Podospora pseudopauciseta]|uniref:2EXR domain-containing protein n=1 Tax=Podospora pseudopauciseta TaxID=2093780 RepID=A0ABR0H022_9PEZI|nr:hypothetical protein QC763_704310 [Podospora pseudopauciseta]
MLLRPHRIITQTNATPTFPFEKLPRELQDEVWKNSDEVDTLWRPTVQAQNSLELARDMIRPKDANGKWLARFRFEYFVSRRIPTLAHVCRNSRQIIQAHAPAPEQTLKDWNRLWYKNTWNDFYGSVVVLEEIYVENKQSLLPILPKGSYLVLELPYGRRHGPIHNLAQGRRLLELIMAAKHDQIKVLLPSQKHHKLSKTPINEKLAAQARFWYDDPLLVSIHDLGAGTNCATIAAVLVKLGRLLTLFWRDGKPGTPWWRRLLGHSWVCGTERTSIEKIEGSTN